MELIDIRSLMPDELEELMKQLGQPKFRAKQLFAWLQSGTESFDEMLNIPVSLRNVLKEKCYIANVSIERRLVSEIDGTVKYLYKLYDGE